MAKAKVTNSNKGGAAVLDDMKNVNDDQNVNKGVNDEGQVPDGEADGENGEPPVDQTALIISRIQNGDILTVRPKMQRHKQEKTVRQLLKLKNKVRFDLAIQRKKVWKKPQKSMLIHSILEEYPIPLLFVKKSDDGILWMMDGQQRLSTIFDYVDKESKDNFALTKDTPPAYIEREVTLNKGTEEEETVTYLEEVEVEGKYFHELPKELQDQIMDYSLTIIEISNITAEQTEELFQRLNAGSPLTAMELTRALSGSETMGFINEVSEMKFFDEFAEVSANGRNRFVDQEIIMAILMLTLERVSGFTSKDIREFAIDLRDIGISDEIRQEIKATTEYLEDAFSTENLVDATALEEGQDAEKEAKKLRSKILKKLNVPMLFHVARTIAIPQEVEVDAFAAWAVKFFVTDLKKKHHEYVKHASSSTGKIAAVKGRKEALTNNFLKEFDIDPANLAATDGQEDSGNEGEDDGEE